MTRNWASQQMAAGACIAMQDLHELHSRRRLRMVFGKIRIMVARKLNVTLPEEIVEAIEDRVGAGQYGSTDDVVAAAFDALLREESEHGERLENIRQQIRASIEDPSPTLTSAEMRAHAENLYARHRG